MVMGIPMRRSTNGKGIKVTQSTHGGMAVSVTEGLGAPFIEAPGGIPVVFVSGGGAAVPVVGGATVGAAGDAGTLYEGYTLSWGDDFNTLNIVGPAKPSGYLTNRGTIDMPGARSGAASPHYYTDPLHTGYNDAGRGAAPITDTLSIQGGTRLKLQTRKATAGEQTSFAPSSYTGGKPVIAASALNTARNILFNVGTAGGEIIVEGKIRHTAKASNPAGWHPTLWTFSGAPTISSETDEWDIVEGSSQAGYLSHNTWAAGTATNLSVDGPIDKFDGADHIWTLVMSQTDAKLYVDGVLTYTKAANTNTKALPSYLILTSVVATFVWGGESFNEAAWTADADGAAMEVDWLRVWRKTGAPHYRPLIPTSDVAAAYNDVTTITLPSAATLWGDGTVTEYVQCIAGEANDPTNDAKFLQFPTGVTYNSGTRQITVDWSASSTPPGRLMFTVQAYKATGSTCEPLTFCVNRGPKINTTAQNWTVGTPVSWDAYAAANVGNLLPKVVAVSGLPSGLSFSAVTGLVTGTPTGAVSGNVSVQVTNSAGQSVTSNVAYTVAVSTPTWATSGALVDLDYENDRAYVNGTYYASMAAARTAGVVVQTSSIDRVALSGFMTTAYTLAGKGTTSATSVIGQSARYLACLDDGADGVPADEIIILGQTDNVGVSNISAQIIAGSVAQETGGAFVSPIGTSAAARIAFSVATNDLAASFNGGTVVTDITATRPTVTQLVVGNREDGTRPWLGTIKRIALLNTAVSDAALPSVLA